MRTSNLITLVALGLGAGAVAGFLFGTEKGKKTRDDLAAMSDEYADKLQAELDHLKENITDAYSNVQEQSRKAMENGKAKAENLKNDVEKTLK